ncbi:DUF5953 family protein [Myxococcus sp. RHSTA-1-4]|uniref:DUF5953 family protein n=1 Tax=Myxococcus sp. RHSTA-1-4 TaxID=2874601 RepID=UPI001CBB788C|nr:DUF5953 family protein [Myxococcus sp. RHSTA-1-4]MBZ4418661.1 DUF5953 family protein [Myxococcus sp. RHSTA-1-4]
MTAAQDSFLLIVYAPALVGDDGRTLAVARGMERAFPGLRLEWTISDEGRLIPLPQRDAWISEATARGELPMLCNGGEGHRVTLTGWERPAGISPGGQSQFEVHAKLPMDAAGITAASNVLEEVADGARAFWGHATPKRAAGDIAEQTSRPLHGPHRPPRGLPVLKKSEDIHSPEIPHRLGWLNYWSAATAQAIGFPDPARDADLLSRSRRTATGGWVVRLTDAPLDLDNPAHLDTLLRAYARFPVIGGRASP